jgi:hypothetical protein
MNTFRSASLVAALALASAVPCWAQEDIQATSISLTYTGDALPEAPWVLINDGPLIERSQHSVSVQDGVLHMVDTARLVGNTLGYARQLPFDPLQTIDVEFRARVLSGATVESVNPDLAPFSVVLTNGVVAADMAVGPSSVTVLGRFGSRPLILNRPIDGTNWHIYRYRVDAVSMQWWVDGVLLDSQPLYHLSQGNPTDLRIIMDITSADADVELDYLTVQQTPSGLANVDELVALQDLTSQFDPTSTTLYPGGLYHISATFQNVSDSDICGAFFQVTQLSGANEVEGIQVEDTGQPIQSRGALPTGTPFTFAAGSTTPFRFDIGVGDPTQRRLQFFVNVAGTPHSPGSCQAPSPQVVPQEE